jgi:anti-anti-sigma factor
VSGQSAQRHLKWPLRITEELKDDVLILVVAGRLGHASAPTLNAAVEQAIERGNRRLVIDFAGVDYFSSAGVTMIAAAASRLERARGVLVLCGVSEPIRLALDLAGLLPRFAIDPSRERAIASDASRRAQ